MNQSIFKRCTSCQKLYLRDEKHECKPKKKHLNILQEVKRILESHNEPMDQAEISRILNKMVGSQMYTQFEISYYLKQKPATFVQAKPHFFGLKEWETRAWIS